MTKWGVESPKRPCFLFKPKLDSKLQRTVALCEVSRTQEAYYVLSYSCYFPSPSVIQKMPCTRKEEKRVIHSSFSVQSFLTQDKGGECWWNVHILRNEIKTSCYFCARSTVP